MTSPVYWRRPSTREANDWFSFREPRLPYHVKTHQEQQQKFHFEKIVFS